MWEFFPYGRVFSVSIQHEQYDKYKRMDFDVTYSGYSLHALFNIKWWKDYDAYSYYGPWTYYECFILT